MTKRNNMQTSNVAKRLRQLKYFLAIPLATIVLSHSAITQAATTNKKVVTKNINSFSNFDRLNLKVDLRAYPMTGEFRFLKISDTNGDVLFLGEVSPDEIFTLPVHKLKTAAKLTIEVFSENGADNRVVLVTKLDK